MDKDQLFELLDLESGSNFQYFENFAELVENDGLIEDDVIHSLLTEVDMKIFAELCESYFYEMCENIPEDHIDLYNLIENIKRSLIGISEAVAAGDKEAIFRLSEELNRFRVWYSADLNSVCRNDGTGEEVSVSIRDALILSRIEKLGGEEYQYDFSEAMDYELEEYIMTYSDIAED